MNKVEEGIKIAISDLNKELKLIKLHLHSLSGSHACIEYKIRYMKPSFISFPLFQELEYPDVARNIIVNDLEEVILSFYGLRGEEDGRAD